MTRYFPLRSEHGENFDKDLVNIVEGGIYFFLLRLCHHRYLYHDPVFYRCTTNFLCWSREQNLYFLKIYMIICNFKNKGIFYVLRNNSTRYCRCHYGSLRLHTCHAIQNCMYVKVDWDFKFQIITEKLSLVFSISALPSG